MYLRAISGVNDYSTVRSDPALQDNGLEGRVSLADLNPSKSWGFDFSVIGFRKIDGCKGVVSGHAVLDRQNGRGGVCIFKKEGIVTHAKP